MIKLTDIAKEKIREIADAEGVALSIRVRVYGAGCNGFAHDMAFEEVSQPSDEVIKIDDIQVIIDEMSSMYLDDTTINYFEKGMLGSGFKFENPNVKSTCGCGNSVSF